MAHYSKAISISCAESGFFSILGFICDLAVSLLIYLGYILGARKFYSLGFKFGY